MTEFEELYRTSLAELGMPLKPEDALGGSIPTWLPASLAAYYRVAGRHPVNQLHNHLFPPDQVELRGGKLVFAEENQGSVIWGFDEIAGTEDPEVWQGQPTAGDYDDSVDWYSEDLPVSQFLVEMWKWTITGESSR